VTGFVGVPAEEFSFTFIFDSPVDQAVSAVVDAAFLGKFFVLFSLGVAPSQGPADLATWRSGRDLRRPFREGAGWQAAMPASHILSETGVSDRAAPAAGSRCRSAGWRCERLVGSEAVRKLPLLVQQRHPPPTSTPPKR
jgi:hypothetical protein